jgi:hypothetical protein
MRGLSLMILIVGVAAAAAGCMSTKCIPTCPPLAGSYLYVPSGLPSPLVNVSADSPCVAKLMPGEGDPAALYVTYDNGTDGVCILHGGLADGQTVTATVSFVLETGGCCPGFAVSGGEFALSDAGTDRG